MTTAEEVKREWRGRVYLARARLIRLTHAWPDETKRNEHQRRAIAQAEEWLTAVEKRAREEGVE